MIVLDASACVELLLESSLGTEIASRLVEESHPVIVPAHFDAEVLSALARPGTSHGRRPVAPRSMA